MSSATARSSGASFQHFDADEASGRIEIQAHFCEWEM